MQKILVAEDETNIAAILRAYLVKAGYEVRLERDGGRVMGTLEQWEPSLVLLDVMLPGVDGWELLSLIRARSACPVIMLTAFGDVQSRLKGLHGGADDYISKPFVGEEVVARIQAVLRRHPHVTTETAALFGSLRIDFAAHEVTVAGSDVRLMPRDLTLLLFLAKHPNQSFEREQLIARVWGSDYDGSDRAVDLAIKRIRRALADWPPHEGEIATLRGLGYQFRVRP